MNYQGLLGEYIRSGCMQIHPLSVLWRRLAHNISRRLTIGKGILNRFRGGKEGRIKQRSKNRGEMFPEFYYPETFQKTVFYSLNTVTYSTLIIISITPRHECITNTNNSMNEKAD